MTLTARLAGTPLAGTGALAKLAFRRDRIMLPAWVYVITVLVASNTYSLNKLYPTALARAALAAGGGHNPALVFLYGRLSGDSLGAVSAWRYGVWAAIFAALMSIFIVVRHTRADEETGRLELVGSAAVGRLAALTAGLLVAVAANVALALLLTIALIFLGLPAAGSAAFALAIATCGLAFAAVAALTAQLAAGARAARGIAIGVLGAAYLLRAVGDAAGSSGPSWLTWLSPLGWTEFVRPYPAGRWWVLALPLALTAAAAAAAYVLAVIRDYGAGLLPDRPGRATASRWLRGPLGLAWRLQWGTLLGWAAGFAFTFAASGAAAKGIGSLLGGSAQLRTAFTRLGGQAGITNAYLAAIMSLAGLAAAAYATSAVLRLRAEETEGRAEIAAGHRDRTGPVGAQSSRRRRGRHRGAARPGRPGRGPRLRVAHRVGRTGGGTAARRGRGSAARVAGRGGDRGSAARDGAPGVGGGRVDRTRRRRGDRPVRPGAAAVPVAARHLAVHARAQAARRPGPAAPMLWLSLAAVAFSAAGLAALRRRDIG